MLSKVGIITRTKNRIVLLKRAIESVLNQEHQDWCHVIVNDGGDAAEVDAILLKYKEKYQDRLIVVHNPQSSGMEAASNMGIRAVNHVDYLTIHDDDDSWYPSFLREMVSSLHQAQKISPTFRSVVCRSEKVMEEINGNIVIEKGSFPYNKGLNNVDLAAMLSENCFPPISFLFEASLIEQIGEFDESLPVLGDWDFHLRVLKKYDIYVLNKMLARYHHRPDNSGVYANSVTGANDKHLMFRSIFVNKKVREGLNSGQSDTGQNIIEQEILHRIQNSVWALNNQLSPRIRKIKKRVNNLYITLAAIVILQVIILLSIWL